MVHATILLASLAAAQAPEVAVVSFDGIAMLQDEQKELLQQLVGEINSSGARAINRMDDWLDGCLDDPGCLAEQPQSAFLAMEVTRVGPLLQVETRVMGRDGAELIKESRSVMQGSPLLGESFAGIVPGLPPPVVVEAAEGEGEGEGEGEPGGAELNLPWWGWAGAGAAAAGVVMFGVGAVVAAGDAAILEDPASLGTEKADARVRGPIALVTAIVGVAVAAGGVSLLLVSLSDE